MATYAVSDLHGQYKMFIKLLEKVGFSADDQLYMLGDAIDRGPDGIKILHHVMNEVYSDFMSADDEDISNQEKNLFEKVYLKLKAGNYERPVIYDSVEIKEGKVWPAVFWPDSKVALFWKNPEQKAQYEQLKTYDWYCFMLEDEAEIDDAIPNIMEVD